MKKIISILFTLSFTVSFSQNITVNESFTPQQLIENILVNSGCVSVSNFSASGGNFGTGELSYGYFNANGSSFPFQEGILLTTGKINSAIGPNANFSDDGNGLTWNGDTDLNNALGLSNTFNATVLEFDFIPNANNISFEYIFSSEQYLLNPTSNQCNFTDGFAFLLKEATATTYQNLALIPGTTTPVRVNTVRGNGTICPPANETYFDAFNTGTNIDGFAPFDLATIQTQIFSGLPTNFTVALFDSTTSTTPLPSNYTNTNDFQQIIYARITNIANCYGNIPITLNVNVFPQIFPDETIGICNNTPTNISAPSGYTYSWNTPIIQTSQTITIANAGTYTVTITNANNCSKTKTFTVVNSEIATIANIEVNDFNENLTATITVTGNGNYEYSLDGITYQNSPVFNLLDSGEYTIYVNDKNNCGVVFETFYALSYPKFFTPNGDNYNDTWQIKNLDKKGLENSKIYIFDRFGKLLKQISATSSGWNGSFNGNPVSSSDYWFVLELTNGKTIKGHFTLKR